LVGNCSKKRSSKSKKKLQPCWESHWRRHPCSRALGVKTIKPRKNKDWLAENAVRIEPVSASKFPASREKNREFCGFRPSAAILASNRSSDSMACRQIPYATEQGIFGGITGNFFQRTGNSRAGAGELDFFARFRLAGSPLPGGSRTLWITTKGFRSHSRPPLLDLSWRNVRRVFPSTAGRLACQTAPSRAPISLSLLPAFADRRSVCIRPSCASWPQ
jgi:hypothetical protein